MIFNINAILIILEYSVKIDVSQVCYKSTSGKQALKIIQENIDFN